MRYLVLILFLSSCGTELIENRPRDFEVRYSVGGGMIDSSEGMTIKPGICKYTRRYEGIENSITFQLQKEELDELYQVFRRNRFDKIRTDNKTLVYDKGGASINLRVGHRFYNVGTSGTFVIRGKKEWRTILAALNKIIERVKKKQEVPLRIILDKSLMNKHIYLNVLQKTLFYGLIDAQSKTRHIVRLIPGKYRIKTQLKKVFDKKNPNKYLYGPRGNIIYQTYNFSLPRDKSITIKLRNGRLIFYSMKRSSAVPNGKR